MQGPRAGSRQRQHSTAARITVTIYATMTTEQQPSQRRSAPQSTSCPSPQKDFTLRFIERLHHRQRRSTRQTPPVRHVLLHRRTSLFASLNVFTTGNDAPHAKLHPFDVMSFLRGSDFTLLLSESEGPVATSPQAYRQLCRSNKSAGTRRAWSPG